MTQQISMHNVTRANAKFNITNIINVAVLAANELQSLNISTISG